MPLQKLQFRPGVNREGTTLANEGGWFESDKVRFRSGYPEKIGGWTTISSATYLGDCRSMHNWVTLNGNNLLGVGTNIKFYIEEGGAYYDVTPVRDTATLTNPFTTVNLSSIVTVTDVNHGAITGDYVTFSGATGLGGNINATILNSQYQITYVDSNTYTINVGVTSSASDTGHGGTVTAQYQINTAANTGSVSTGWSAGLWGGTVAGAATTVLTNSIISTTLTAAITASSTSAIAVGSTTGFSSSGTIQIDNELITYTRTTSTTFEGTITRGTGGTTPAAHYNSSVVVNGATSQTISVLSTTGFPAITSSQISPLQIDNELITYTGPLSNPFTGIKRGANGTAVAGHANSSNVLDASIFYGWGQSTSTSANNSIRLWSQTNFGQELLFTYRGGALYHWGPGTGPNPDYSNTNRSALIGSLTANATTTTSSTTLTINSVSVGSVLLGMVITGSGIPTGTKINSFDTGTGGAGTYIMSAAATPGTTQTITGTSDCPTILNIVLESDATRITIAFGCNDYGSTILDPLLIRWSAQESYTNWTPSAANQAGSYRLSRGSAIVSALQTRQEILVWTDAAIYSMQYLGPPYVYGFTLLADNVSIVSQNAVATANGVTYWMGADKFYVYSGRVETLPCALRTYVYDNINLSQASQIFCGTNEGYSEIWWFYCSITGPDNTGTITNPNSTVDRYVIFNYLDRVWYYGTLGRTAWNDSPLRAYPQAASYVNKIVNHESGNDDGITGNAINAYIQSSDFDIGDGHNYGFVWQIVPDITFDGSTTASPDKPSVNFIVRPRQNPGAAYGTADTPTVSSTVSYAGQSTYNVQQFTEIVYTRVRGRQMAFRVESNTLGTQWQLGVPSMNVRPDGRR